MLTRRCRVIGWAAGVLVAAWLLAWGGYRVALGTKMTSEKVAAYAASVDFGSLEGDARARALSELIRRINALPIEERRRFRVGREWAGWFEAMTETEKGQFIEGTLPTGFKQVLASFEELPEARRKAAIDDALRRLDEARRLMVEEGDAPELGTNAPPELSAALRDKAVRIGLKTFYSESSARTKAELAPVLEEIQHAMESGRYFRRSRREPPSP